MRRFGVRLTATAARHVADARAWWEANRADNPELFVDELSVRLGRLARTPSAGAVYARHDGSSQVRRVLLRRTGYHVYYTVDAKASEIIVRAVWHAMRGYRPGLR